MSLMQSKGFFQQTFISVALAGLLYYLNIMAIPVIVLVCIMLIDYITGMISAWVNAELSSKKGIIGIVKKICYLFAIAAAMGIDWLIYSGMTQIGIQLDYTIFFGVLVTIWLIEVIDRQREIFKYSKDLHQRKRRLCMQYKITSRIHHTLVCIRRFSDNERLRIYWQIHKSR